MKYSSVKYNAPSLTAEFISEDGTHYLRSGGTICGVSLIQEISGRQKHLYVIH